MKGFFAYLTENQEVFSLLFEFIMAATGFSAIVIYKLQERTKLRTAATLILEQIDEIENIVQNFNDIYTHNPIKEIDDDSMYLAKEIPYSGAWEQYQHLILRKLSLKEVSLVNDFFESAYRIEKARSDVIYSFKLGWQSKSFTTQLINMKFLDPTFAVPTNFPPDPTGLINIYMNNSTHTVMFKPNIAYKLLYAELETYSKLNGTTAYAKLYKLSYRK